VSTLSSRRLFDGYDKVQLNDCTIYIRKNFHNQALEQVLATGRKALAEKYHLTQITASEFACIFKFDVEFSGHAREVFYKEYLCRSTWDSVKHLFRASRASRAFRGGLMLQKEGFYVPEVIAFGEEKSGFICRRNFLLTRQVEDAQQLSILLSSLCQNLTKEALRDKRRLIKAFGQTIGKMHAAGVFHGDLRLGNILAKRNKAGWQFFFLDNERTRKFSKLPEKLRLKNLVQVNMFRKGISNTDRSRFLKAYIEENPTIVSAQKSLAQKITTKTNSRLTNKNKSLPR
jgi:tRNA A-37 threonylcarbamoyl transferase component Bud32